MPIQKVTLGELREIAPSMRKDDAGAQNQFRYAPMFLPVDATSKKDTGVVKVVTRQKFLDENINHWVQWRFTQGAALGLGVAALALIGVNVLLSGAAALGAGYCYGEYKKKDFIINRLLKNRWLLEGT
ncbi:MAG: hypothetical protein NTY90_01095 [Candidatus Micrarchaeota archaeon]|nr:hypothetical protein [Candidatus Micrarchaeota archaeon]